MGYTTQFKGELKFTRELTGSELAKLKSMLGQDCRNHPEWDAGNGLYYIDLALLDDFSGLKWDGSEKTYNMDCLVNVVIKEMRKTVPDFSLTGKLVAQGEDIDDRWELLIGEDGLAIRKNTPPSGAAIICPHCEGKVYVDEAIPADADRG
jgi:hypothetical protein